jgi:hypothetical protein
MPGEKRSFDNMENPEEPDNTDTYIAINHTFRNAVTRRTAITEPHTSRPEEIVRPTYITAHIAAKRGQNEAGLLPSNVPEKEGRTR